MTNKQAETFVSVAILLPMFFLIRSNWLVGGLLVIVLLACYLKMGVFLKLRKEVKGFPFLAWAPTFSATLVGIAISANREFYEIYKPFFIVFWLLILASMIKPHNRVRHFFEEKGDT